jgi:hypothetical protein
MPDRPESAEKDLAGLVLTIVELLRQLMERQALRRVDDGSLTEPSILQGCRPAEILV